MSSDDWNRLQDCFALALDLAPEARERYVAELGRAEPEFGARLRQLLAADAASDAAARAAVDACVESLARETPDPWIGRVLGDWKILRRLAGGGMGAVFIAERADSQFSQTVALKVMAAQLVDPAAVARFRAERQILASLNHPYIAKLIDGGTGPDGLPYLVMEYVDGAPIDDHCERHGLDVPARLQLFRKVCEAVDYAHRRLVVHRDLKPSNILVDAEGAPRLLDFGIAKLLEGGDAAMSALTRAGGSALTPEYASPEQVRGEAVSVATDVYSLGVLLFRLLTGQSPYARSIATPAEYLQAIVTEDARRPSTAVPEAAPTPDAAATARLRRQLAGDLDNIVLKALQKAPERRYATASAFAADIGRHLDHEPVEARGDALGYRVAKFARRHRAAVAATAVLVTTITGLVLFYTLRLADERDRAEVAAARAQEVSRFVGTLFEGASPFRTRGQSVSAIDLLKRGVERVDELDREPDVQADLLHIIGRSLTALGDFDSAIPLLERALALKQSAPVPDDAAVAEVLGSLAAAIRIQGDAVRAVPMLRRALEMNRKALGEDAPGTIRSIGSLGVTLFHAGQFEESIEYSRAALEQYIANGEGESSGAIDMRGNMSIALDSLGRYAEAEGLLRETLGLSEKIDGALHPNTVIRMHNLALLMLRQGRASDAVPQLEATLARARQTWPARHPQIPLMLSTLGTALKEVGRIEDSRVAYGEAAEIVRSSEGENSMAYVARLRALGSLEVDVARYTAAEAAARRAIAIVTSMQGDRSPELPAIQILLSRALNGAGRFRAAEAELARLQASGLSMSAWLDQLRLREWATALGSLGRHDEAEPHLLGGLAQREAVVGVDNPTLVPFLTAASAHYRRAGNPSRALEYAGRAVAIARGAGDNIAWLAGEVLAEHGRALAAVGRRDEAERSWREAEAFLVRVYGTADPRVAEVRRLLRR